MMVDLKEIYKKDIRKKLKDKFAYSNPMQIPTLKKIVINMGVAEALKDKNVLQDCVREMELLSGQKPVVTKSKKAISNFKLRKDVPIGVKVTLRKHKMWDFLVRFINIVAPRIRDFRGFPTKCDGNGNYTLGLTDQQIYPEINLDDVKRVQGMHITFVTSATNDDECIDLLREMGMPFEGLPVTIAV